MAVVLINGYKDHGSELKVSKVDAASGFRRGEQK
jgi:hypothetical protein